MEAVKPFSSAPPIDEINVARRDYAAHTAKAADIDMRLIANAAERDRLELEHDNAKSAAATARSRVFELENNRAKPEPVEARVMSAFQATGHIGIVGNATDFAALKD